VEQIEIGSSGLKTSRIGLGTWAIGQDVVALGELKAALGIVAIRRQLGGAGHRADLHLRPEAAEPEGCCPVTLCVI
jgi:hypothetical protein